MIWTSGKSFGAYRSLAVLGSLPEISKLANAFQAPFRRLSDAYRSTYSGLQGDLRFTRSKCQCIIIKLALGFQNTITKLQLHLQ